jgi:phosphohistidine swiveling domain-containing protein
MGQQVYVVFEHCDEPPFWLDRRNDTAQAAVHDALRARRSLELRGDPISRPVEIMSATEDMIVDMVDDDELEDDQCERASEMRDIAREAASAAAEAVQEAGDRAYAAELGRIGEEVRRQAGSDTLALKLLDGTVVDVPRAPFVRWACSRLEDVDESMLPPWQPVSSQGHKCPGDDVNHTDWMCGARLNLTDAYKPNVSSPAWDLAAELQVSIKHAHLITPAESHVPAGIMAALDLLRSSTVKVTVIVAHDDVTGVIGEGIVVIPDLSPLQVPSIVNASAVITEQGDPASHLAIVARGRNLPVVRVRDALQLFKHGDRVCVSTRRGTVTVITDDD